MTAAPIPSNPTGSVRSDGGGTVLVPVFGDEPPDGTIEFAVDLAQGSGGDVTVMAADTKPMQVPFDSHRSTVDDDRPPAELLRGAEAYAGSRTRIDARRLLGSTRSRAVLAGVETYEADKLVVSTGSPSHLTTMRPSTTTRIVERADCDVYVAARIGTLDRLTSILVPIAGGPHSGRAVDTARVLAEVHGAEIDLFHVDVPSVEDEDRPSRVISAAIDRLGAFEDYDTWILEADDAADAIIEQSRYYSATILGWPRTGRLYRFVVGSTTGRVAVGADSPVFSVRSADAGRTWVDRWLARGT